MGIKYLDFIILSTKNLQIMPSFHENQLSSEIVVFTANSNLNLSVDIVVTLILWLCITASLILGASLTSIGIKALYSTLIFSMLGWWVFRLSTIVEGIIIDDRW